MLTKFFRYHILEKDYAGWLILSRESNRMYAAYKDVSFQQSPTRKIGGTMFIEEIVIYPSKQEADRIEREITARPESSKMREVFLNIIQGDVQMEELGE